MRAVLPSFVSAASVAIAFALEALIENRNSLDWVPLALLIAFVVALLHVALLGAPICAYLQRRGWLYWWSSSIAGAFVGVTPAILLLLFHDTPTYGLDLVMGIFGISALGAVGGLAYWAGRRVVQPGNLRQ